MSTDLGLLRPHISIVSTGSHFNEEDSTAPPSVFETEKASPVTEKFDSALSSTLRVTELGSLVSMVDEKPALVDPDGTLRARGERRMRIVKSVFGFGLLGFK